MKRPANLAPVITAYERGDSCRVIAGRYGVNHNTVRTWLLSAGVQPRRAGWKVRYPNKGVRDTERASEIARLYRDGQTLQAIGDRFGITRERVRQLLRKLQIEQEEGGSCLRGKRRQYQTQLRRKALYLRRFGMSREQYEELREIGAVRAYREQKRNAAGREIEWHFTLAEWWEVWKSSGKWDERGRGNGYVMARHGDVGPYAPNNVKIIHSVANLIECYERMGKDCSKARAKYGLTEEAFT